MAGRDATGGRRVDAVTWAACPGVALPQASRAGARYRRKTVWDTGSLVTRSSDDIAHDDFSGWSPCLGMGVAMTRQATERTRLDECGITTESFPSTDDRMGGGEMALGSTVNDAIRLGVGDARGSVACGRDADLPVFERDLTCAGREGLGHTLPCAFTSAERG